MGMVMETTLHENLRGPPQFQYVAAPDFDMTFSTGPMPTASDLAYTEVLDDWEPNVGTTHPTTTEFTREW